MGKQLNIYLPDDAMKRLSEVANKQCRRPHDQARYILLSGLGLADTPVSFLQQPNGAPIEDSANQTICQTKG